MEAVLTLDRARRDEQSCRRYFCDYFNFFRSRPALERAEDRRDLFSPSGAVL